MPTRPGPFAALALAAAVAAAVLPACGSRGNGAGAGTKAAACGAEVREQLDSRSTQHIFPGAAEPAYLTDPPTSGPHRLGAAPTGVAAAPIDRPLQVHMLEDGAVLVQHRDLPPGQLAALEQLAGGEVVVAPNPSLPAPVVATAWTVKLTCSSVDPAALRRFARAHAGKGAGHA